MFETLRSARHETRRCERPLPLLAVAALIGLASVGSMGCEDKAIGRLCDVQADAGPGQAVFNGQALECPSRICLRPARDNMVASDLNTAPLCSAECSKDSDCDGETRTTDPKKKATDRRCVGGFVCGVTFEVGPLCCKKLCMCKDFISPGTDLKTPVSCAGPKTADSCQNL